MIFSFEETCLRKLLVKLCHPIMAVLSPSRFWARGMDQRMKPTDEPNGKRKSGDFPYEKRWFPHEKWWFSIVMLMEMIYIYIIYILYIYIIYTDWLVVEPYPSEK